MSNALKVPKKRIFQFLYSIIKNKKISFYIYSLHFIFGTFIHETSHFLAALFLLVPVGKMELMPEVNENENHATLVSVEIAKTDPIRRFLIGVAPFVIGISIICVILYYSSADRLLSEWWGKVFAAILIFEIANSMFASKKDLEGADELFIVITILGTLIYLSDISLPFIQPGMIYSDKIIELMRLSDLYLLAPIIIDSIILLIIRV